MFFNVGPKSNLRNMYINSEFSNNQLTLLITMHRNYVSQRKLTAKCHNTCLVNIH